MLDAQDWTAAAEMTAANFTLAEEALLSGELAELRALADRVAALDQRFYDIEADLDGRVKKMGSGSPLLSTAKMS